MKPAINTHGYVMPLGKHKGEPITQVPVGYLTWMVGSNHSLATFAQAELDRRGTVVPDLDVSGHAIDRASLSCRKIWHQNRGENEGLHAWLVRRAGEALRQPKDHKGRHVHLGMLWVFEFSGKWPVLKTVMRQKQRGHE